ncbi:MAG: hypothetical protein JWM80_5723 [Cyanobacteria bacterium RYN_339]|nr:hypothetical protein [Cyanobacteria bacterium RYN_339]
MDLLGLPLSEALARCGGPAPTIVRTAPSRSRQPLPTSDEDWRVVRVDADAWVVAPALPLP